MLAVSAAGARIRHTWKWSIPLTLSRVAFNGLRPDEIEHSTRLFRGPLEKGVILRSRLRGVFVPRSNDIRAAGIVIAISLLPSRR